MELFQKAWDFILSGGPVMWPLMAASLWLWSLVLFKTFWLAWARRESSDLDQARAYLRNSDDSYATQGPRSAALAYFQTMRTGNPISDVKLWEVAVRHQSPHIWRHITAITVLAAVPPLLGLLGTINGMIETFGAIQLYGTGNAQAMAVGISEALITTQTGLLLAIPGLFAAHTLRRQANKIQLRLLSFQRGVDRWLVSGEDAQCCA